MRVGVRRRKSLMGDAWREGLSEVDEEWSDEDEDEAALEQEGMAVTKMCRKMGGSLEAIAQLLEACFSPEILKAK